VRVHQQSLCGAMRGFGVPQAAFAHESQMDLLAKALHMDPLEIRRINALKSGSRTATGQRLKESVGIGNVSKRWNPTTKKPSRPGLTEKTGPSQKRGVGLGAMWYGIGNTGVQNPSTAHMEMDAEGRITLFTGCADIGQGSTTVLSQIAAQVMGVLRKRLKRWWGYGLHIQCGRHIRQPADLHLGKCGKKCRGKTGGRTPDRRRGPAEKAEKELVLDDGFVWTRKIPVHRVSFSRIAARAAKRGIPLSWQDILIRKRFPWTRKPARAPYATYAYACHVALVTVDTLTGEVTLRRSSRPMMWVAPFIRNRWRARSCGGVAMGVGMALMEEYDPLTTESMKDYHIPTSSDMPEVVPIIVESPEPTGPFGAKGVGEPALIPTAPAIVNSITNALGKRIYHLPANLERVLAASIQSGNFRLKEVA
jgi:CO/xanthine dehydrogenase Mo-binding subunit